MDNSYTIGEEYNRVRISSSRYPLFRISIKNIGLTDGLILLNIISDHYDVKHISIKKHNGGS